MRGLIPLALAAIVQAGHVPSQEAIAQTGDISTDHRDDRPTVWKHIDMISVPFVHKIYPNNRPVIPIADGTREDCTEYSWYKDYEFRGQEIERDCWGIAMFYEITPEEFILWNPSMAKNGTRAGASSVVTVSPTSTVALPLNYWYPCTISPSTSYCVASSTPTS